MSETVRIEYHRPPDRTQVFQQQLVFSSDDVIVTYLASTPLPRALVIDGQVALEDGSPAVWFTFPGVMHDIGRFHTADGAFTGLYANVLLPVDVRSRLDWRVTDLFVDVWVGSGRKPLVLDADELAEAVAQQWLSASLAAAAQAEANRIVELYEAGGWPPPIVNEWPLARVLRS